MQLRCLLTAPCDGALLLLQPNGPSSPSGVPRSDWVGGSDFHVPARSSASVPIGLTPLGERLVSAANGYKAAVALRLRVYGSSGNPGPDTLMVR